MARALVLLLLSLFSVHCVALKRVERVGARSSANPIRKVVTMLQKMQSQVTAEGEKQKELFDKFNCYCKTNGGALSASIAAAKNKIEALTSALASAAARKKQTEASLKEHQTSRTEAKATIAQSTSLREKEASAYGQFKADSEANLAALTKAIAAIDSGMFGSFLQTTEANLVRKFAMEKADIPDMSRQELLAFLSGSHSLGYVPQSHEIAGILKTIRDEMQQGLDEATSAENKAKALFDQLMAAKQKEVAALTKQIESELTTIGELGVTLASSQIELDDTRTLLADDEKFLVELKGGCDTKAAEYEEIKKTRAQELVALAETINVLNSDDALELFKKTLPSASASASLLQVKVRSTQMRSQALSMVRDALDTRRRSGVLAARPQLDLIALALSGKQQGFEKVISMIDTMIGVLQKEQSDDNDKKEYCEGQFDVTDDKRKTLENSVSNSEAAVADMEGSIAELTEEIATLQADIKALDAEVADATDLRKKENSDYKALMAADSTAKDVLLWAKNRLNKFYNPRMHKAPSARELSDTESVTVSMGGTLAPTPAPGGIGGTGIGAFVEVAPPPPPKTFGAYTKKGEESGGVLAMIDLLVNELDKEMQEATVTEKDSQKDYETMMSESANTRADDSKALADKVSYKASQEAALQAESEKKTATTNELMATHEYIASLHGECDWLLKNWEVRKIARTEEVESLGRAKAVLSGADFALL